MNDIGNFVGLFAVCFIGILLFVYRGVAETFIKWAWQRKIPLAFIGAFLFTVVELVGMQALVGLASPLATLAFQLLFAILFMVVQFGAMMWIMSRPRVTWYIPGKSSALKLTFDDYVGNPVVLELLKETVANIQSNTKFKQMGGVPSRGILMSGPPGTGKSYGARVVAAVCHIPFCLVDAASLQSAFMGMGSMTVNNLYRKARGYARKYGACIIFLDELDAIGTSRSSQGPATGMMGGMMMGGGSQLLNTLLTNLDPTPSDTFINSILRRLGFPVPPADNPYVLTMAATNLPEALDKALVREGRMDHIIPVDLPDLDGRIALFAYELAKIKTGSELNVALLNSDPDSEEAALVAANVRILALQTPGWSPAAIKAIVSNKAPQVAARAESEVVRLPDVISARRTKSFGLKAPLRAMPYDEKRRIAYHEAGHAFVATTRRKDVFVEYATCLRRENALGLVAYSFGQERHTTTLRELLAQIESCLASRAVEIEILDESMSGFSGDLNTATRIATGMITVYGMDDVLVSTPALNAAAVPSAKVNRINQRRMAICRAIVRTYRDAIIELAETLLQKEEMDGDEVRAIIAQYVSELEIPDSPELMALADEIETQYYADVEAHKIHLIGEDSILPQGGDGKTPTNKVSNEQYPIARSDFMSITEAGEDWFNE